MIRSLEEAGFEITKVRPAAPPISLHFKGLERLKGLLGPGSRSLAQLFTVWVVDAWDEKAGESYVAVFASQKAAKADLQGWFEDRNRAGVKPEHNGLFGDVLKRRVRA
jgi:hypothetical protein